MTELTPDPHDTTNQLHNELANIHRVHIYDIRALLAQFEAEKTEWEQKLQEAVGRECGALCGDVEQDRDDLTREIEKLREGGVPGVMHQVDQLRLQVIEGDRDRFANLHANLVRRNRNLVGEFRTARHASRNVRLVEGLLADALGREPGSINGDNIEDAFAELVKERDHYRSQLAIWAAPDSSFNQNEQVVESLRDRIGLAVGTDVPRDQLVEMFDHLVSQYIGGERIVEAKPSNVTRGRLEAAEARVAQLVDDADRREAEVARTHANWTAEMTAEKARYASLESAAQAVGRQLIETLAWCDRARHRRVADADLLRDAHELISSIGEGAMPNWMSRSRAWIATFNTRDGASTALDSPLAGFVVRVYNDGQHERVQLIHRSDTCRYDMIFQAVPSTEVDLGYMLDEAHRHVLRAHPIKAQDEASPDDGTLPYEDICHPSQGAYCGNTERPPTEVKE